MLKFTNAPKSGGAMSLWHIITYSFSMLEIVNSTFSKRKEQLK